ncbi:MAG: tRNA 2-selenouridine(34) synthase MnmH [Dethiobacteria bacterium]|jgi:tRNA 2-selenouridine synthase
MYGDITVQEAIKLPTAIFIDLRSPHEYGQGSIPGSVNIPLFNDQEREIIGLQYKEDRHHARMTGLNLVSPKLPEIMEKIIRLGYNRIPVVYCWRGGLRSKSVYNLLETVGIPAYRLPGGYKAYRRFILDQLTAYELKKPLFVLNGLTGTGKTEILRLLMARDCPGIDLEDLARHRGSLFGHIGFREKRCQKDFDALLWNRLEELQSAPYLLLEGEGKRIGSVYLPAFLFQSIQEGAHILLTAPLEKRVERLLKEYTPSIQDEIEEIEGAIQSLKKYLGAKTVAHFLLLLEQENYPELIRLLCERYYDRLYSESQPEKTGGFALAVDSSNPEKAAAEIMQFVQQALATQNIQPRA